MKINKLEWGMVALGISVLVALLGTVKYFSLSSQLSETASSTATLVVRLDTLESALKLAESKNIDLATALQEEQDQRSDVERQIKKITSTVGNLKKLSETDKELLQKYSKVYFLNEHYVPSDLVDIDPRYTTDAEKEFQIHQQVWPFLKDMLKDAASDGIDLKVESAYRSFSTQTGLKSKYVVTYGAGTANQFSAEQGFSEHQLGTAVDLSSGGLGASRDGFENSDAYTWLQRNAYRYGFTLSYPPGNAYYQFEPWHWRFVGLDLAGRLHKEKQYFYDLDQREIDKYLLNIFE